MTCGELKTLLNNPMLEDRHEIVGAFPAGDDEEREAVLDCAIENHAGGRKVVFRFDLLPGKRVVSPRGGWDTGDEYDEEFTDADDDNETRACRVCGCTDDDCAGCIERTGEACHWVAEDLCSACADEEAT